VFLFKGLAEMQDFLYIRSNKTQFMTTIEIPLKGGRYAIIDMEDLELVMRYDWWVRGGNGSKNLYARSYSKSWKRELGMHGYLMQCPPDMIVDHINGNGLDNRRCNLRICTKEQNAKNRPKQSNHSNKFKSVFKRGSDMGHI